MAAHSHENLGIILRELRQYDKAMQHGQAASAMNQLLSNEEDPEIGANHFNIGAILLARGRANEALEQFKQGYKIFLGTLGQEHEWTQEARGSITRCEEQLC